MNPAALTRLARDIAIFLLLLTLACGGGYWLGYTRGALEVAKIRADYAAERTATAQATAQALKDAQDRADQITRQLSAARQEETKLTQGKKHEIQTVTTGRGCLDEPALRLLDNAPGLSVSAPTGKPHGADAARIATDTDLGNWALDAGGRYAECARRLDALIDWHGGQPQ